MEAKPIEITKKLIEQEGKKWEALVRRWYKLKPSAQDGYIAGFLRAQELQNAMVISLPDESSKADK
jgi:hypothetical protein